MADIASSYTTDMQERIAVQHRIVDQVIHSVSLKL